MTVLSGKLGLVNGINGIKNWSLEESIANFAKVTSATECGTERNSGVKSWSGSFDIDTHTPPATLIPGLTFAFAGYTGPTTGVEGTNGQLFTGTARVDSVTINWPIQAGEDIMSSVSFTGDGVLTSNASGSPTLDVSQPALIPTCGTKLDYGAAASEVELADVLDMNLTFTAGNSTYNSSSSSCWTKTVPGPIDWSLSVTIGNDNRPFTLGEAVRLRAWVDGTDYWLLEYGRFAGYSGLVVDRSSNSIVQQTLTFEMTTQNDSGTEGVVTVPGGGTNWWN